MTEDTMQPETRTAKEEEIRDRMRVLCSATDLSFWTEIEVTCFTLKAFQQNILILLQECHFYASGDLISAKYLSGSIFLPQITFVKHKLMIASQCIATAQGETATREKKKSHLWARTTE